MRRNTMTILAVVMTASALPACTASTEEPILDPRSPEERVATGATTATGDPAPGTAAPAPTPAKDEAASASGPAAAGACDERQKEVELSGLPLEDAIAKRSQFRCLCDAEGYPLVGNTLGKAITTPSEFCNAIRERGLL
ncbi:MAG: hypothetical protein JST00_12665 [Deltaproteobacteria bacterium]|nr:hypothetical protein [Deltaproteobacteria bacterium]